MKQENACDETFSKKKFQEAGSFGISLVHKRVANLDAWVLFFGLSLNN